MNVSHDVSLFPNPSPGSIYMKYPMNWFEDVQIFDISGKLLQRRNISRTSTQQTINTSLPTGVYFVQLNGKGRIAIKKLIIPR
jgi:hypothetical protein